MTRLAVNDALLSGLLRPFCFYAVKLDDRRALEEGEACGAAAAKRDNLDLQ